MEKKDRSGSGENSTAAPAVIKRSGKAAASVRY